MTIDLEFGRQLQEHSLSLNNRTKKHFWVVHMEFGTMQE
jgi:hypothetical protein